MHRHALRCQQPWRAEPIPTKAAGAFYASHGIQTEARSETRDPRRAKCQLRQLGGGFCGASIAAAGLAAVDQIRRAWAVLVPAQSVHRYLAGPAPFAPAAVLMDY